MPLSVLLPNSSCESFECGIDRFDIYPEPALILSDLSFKVSDIVKLLGRIGSRAELSPFDYLSDC